MATGSRPSPGWTCCVTALGAGCVPRSSRSVTAHSGSGVRYARCFATTREQRCWFGKIANILSALPTSTHPGAKKALAEIWNAEDKRHALDAAAKFRTTYGAKFTKATAKLTDDLDELLAFYDFPAEHWIHLRTTNPIVISSRSYHCSSRPRRGDLVSLCA